MSEQAGELKMYAVELKVEGVAVVTLAATSPDEASAIAEERTRPVDVTELDLCKVLRVVAVAAIRDELQEAARARARESLQEGREGGGQV